MGSWRPLRFPRRGEGGWPESSLFAGRGRDARVGNPGALPPRRRPPAARVGGPLRAGSGGGSDPPAAAERRTPGPRAERGAALPPRRGEDGGRAEEAGREATPGRSALKRTEEDGSPPTTLQPRDPEAPIDRKATLSQAWPREEPGAAKCVRSVDDQCVLQFTLVLAASCVLHRRTSRVIHR